MLNSQSHTCLILTLIGDQWSRVVTDVGVCGHWPGSGVISSVQTCCCWLLDYSGYWATVNLIVDTETTPRVYTHVNYFKMFLNFLELMIPDITKLSWFQHYFYHKLELCWTWVVPFLGFYPPTVHDWAASWGCREMRSPQIHPQSPVGHSRRGQPSQETQRAVKQGNCQGRKWINKKCFTRKI